MEKAVIITVALTVTLWAARLLHEGVGSGLTRWFSDRQQRRWLAAARTIGRLSRPFSENLPLSEDVSRNHLPHEIGFYAQLAALTTDSDRRFIQTVARRCGVLNRLERRINRAHGTPKASLIAYLRTLPASQHTADRFAETFDDAPPLIREEMLCAVINVAPHRFVSLLRHYRRPLSPMVCLQLYTLWITRVGEFEDITPLLYSYSDSVVIFALRLLRRENMRESALSVRQLLNHPAYRVRYEVLLTLMSFQLPLSDELLANLYANLSDPLKICAVKFGIETGEINTATLMNLYTAEKNAVVKRRLLIIAFNELPESRKTIARLAIEAKDIITKIICREIILRCV